MYFFCYPLNYKFTVENKAEKTVKHNIIFHLLALLNKKKFSGWMLCLIIFWLLRRCILIANV